MQWLIASTSHRLQFKYQLCNSLTCTEASLSPRFFTCKREILILTLQAYSEGGGDKMKSKNQRTKQAYRKCSTTVANVTIPSSFLLFLRIPFPSLTLPLHGHLVSASGLPETSKETHSPCIGSLSAWRPQQLSFKIISFSTTGCFANLLTLPSTFTHLKGPILYS